MKTYILQSDVIYCFRLPSWACCFWHLPQEQAALEMEASSRTQKRPVSPNSNYRDKYSHLIGTSAAKDAAHTLEANQSYGCGEYSNNWPSLLLVCDVSLPSFESHLLFLQSLWPIRGTRAPSRKLWMRLEPKNGWRRVKKRQLAVEVMCEKDVCVYMNKNCYAQ